jgi:hypothetical protein
MNSIHSETLESIQMQSAQMTTERNFNSTFNRQDIIGEGRNSRVVDHE